MGRKQDEWAHVEVWPGSFATLTEACATPAGTSRKYRSVVTDDECVSHRQFPDQWNELGGSFGPSQSFALNRTLDQTNAMSQT